jgi:hypothetical protein
MAYTMLSQFSLCFHFSIIRAPENLVITTWSISLLELIKPATERSNISQGIYLVLFATKGNMKDGIGEEYN